MTKYQLGSTEEEGRGRRRMAGDKLVEGANNSNNPVRYNIGNQDASANGGGKWRMNRNQAHEQYKAQNAAKEEEANRIVPNIEQPSVIGALDHKQIKTPASDHAMNTVYSNKSGLNESGGKQWADKWSKGYDKRGQLSGAGKAQQFTDLGINNANNALDVTALAKTVDQRPLYHQAKGTVYQSEWAGDKWNKDYETAAFQWPENLSEIEKPDLDTTDIIKDIKKIG